MPRFLDVRNEGPLRRLLLLPLALIALFYAGGAALHRLAYERGFVRRRRLPCRVVSVGGITAGGSGKTPLAAFVAGALRSRGHRAALASRGYGRAGRDRVVVVSDGHHVTSAPEQSGDEPFLMAALAPGVPVLVARDRGVAGLRAISAFGADVLVLDDGFQHHRLARDVEILGIDGRQGLGNGHVLPRGPLRESPSALSRADGIVVIDGPLAPADDAAIARIAPEARRFAAQRVPSGWRPLGGGPLQPVASLCGLRVGLLAGIARPESFRRTVEALGARVVAERFFGDHHRFRPKDVVDFPPGVSTWLTTEKDAVKIVAAWAGGIDLRVLAIALELDDAEAFASWLDHRLRRRSPSRASPGARR